MPTFLLSHHHRPDECRFAFAAWRGFPSPLRRAAATCSCRSGDHGLWWTVQAPDPETALSHLPDYLAARTSAAQVQEVPIP
jgi:hypothetical protein